MVEFRAMSHTYTDMIRQHISNANRHIKLTWNGIVIDWVQTVSCIEIGKELALSTP